jgi:deoxyadenosine/deoxycytidine kinase
MSKEKIQVISVEGNIGCGKSTFMKKLRKDLPSTINGKTVVFADEPVEEWKTITNKDGTPMLSLYYSDSKKYSFQFQMMAYITRLNALLECVNKHGKDIIIVTERCLKSDRDIFAKMLYDDGLIEEQAYQIYTKWFDSFKAQFGNEKRVYIKSDPSICAQRVKKRNRDGEEGIPLSYLSKVNDYHELMIKDLPEGEVINLDGNIEISSEDSDQDEREGWVDSVVDFISQ